MKICVYCSSSDAVAEPYWAETRELGDRIGRRGHTLVYGGANVGLMGALAQSALSAGAQVVGVIPRRLQELGLAYRDADRMIVADTMAERKAAMEELADGFIALPGGFGTLEELLQVLTLKQLGYVRGNVVLLNVASFWDGLLAHLEMLYQRNFAKPAYRQLYAVASSAGEALDLVERTDGGDLPQKWF